MHRLVERELDLRAVETNAISLRAAGADRWRTCNASTRRAPTVGASTSQFIERAITPRPSNSGAAQSPPRGRSDGLHDDEHRVAESARKAATLADREAREAVVRADGRSIREYEWPRRQRRRIGTKSLANDLGVVAVRDEANVLTLDLLGDQLEAELVRHRARLRLGLRSNRQNHAPQHGAVDAPEEVRLILGVIEAAQQFAAAAVRA